MSRLAAAAMRSASGCGSVRPSFLATAARSSFTCPIAHHSLNAAACCHPRHSHQQRSMMSTMQRAGTRQFGMPRHLGRCGRCHPHTEASAADGLDDLRK